MAINGTAKRELRRRCIAIVARELGKESKRIRRGTCISGGSDRILSNIHLQVASLAGKRFDYDYEKDREMTVAQLFDRYGV